MNRGEGTNATSDCVCPFFSPATNPARFASLRTLTKPDRPLATERAIPASQKRFESVVVSASVLGLRRRKRTCWSQRTVSVDRYPL